MQVLPDCSVAFETPEDITRVWLGDHPTPILATCNGRKFEIWTEGFEGVNDEPAQIVEVHIAEKRRTAIIEAEVPVTAVGSLQVAYG